MIFFWFRRDLRLVDNHGLFEALRRREPVQPVFIFDHNILNELPRKDARVEFILESLNLLDTELQKYGSRLLCLKGKPEDIWSQLIKKFKPKAIVVNQDYEPYAIQRDEQIQKLAESQGVEFLSFKDQVIFEKSEILNDQGGVYKVFTPYSKKWKKSLSKSSLTPFPSEDLLKYLSQDKLPSLPTLSNLGFEPSGVVFPPRKISKEILLNYSKTRDYPAGEGTSRLGLHLRFGTLSVRKAVIFAKKYSDTWLNELIWREFFMMLLYHFPYSARSSFKKEYDQILWRNDKKEFEKWKMGQTGFPLVDAGMRELLATGHMHNRVRMVVASFLCKHLLIDWRWGERWFAEKLLDYELSSNVGNWQWAAGSGADAAPYFRIFNPDTQWKKFDPDEEYTKKWIPEWGTTKYPPPMIEPTHGRERALRVYAKAVKGKTA